MTAIGVVAAAASYRVAQAELIHSTFLCEVAAQSVVVIDATPDWCNEVLHAIHAKAAAVVVADPFPTSAAKVTDLIDRAGHIPVILDRRFLRPDTVEDVNQLAVPAPRAIVVDGRAPAGLSDHLRQDAAGWLRVLSPRRTPSARCSTSTAGTMSVSRDWFRWQTDADAKIVAGMTLLVGGHAAASLQIRTIGEAPLALSFADDFAPHLSLRDARGRLTTPLRYESRQRLALRRAVAAAHAGERPPDLIQLLSDVTSIQDASF